MVFFLVSSKTVVGIICPMPFKGCFLLKILILTLAFQTAGLTPLWAPQAHALYWEDDGDEGNNPNEVKRRPDHFGLFDWVDYLNKDSKKKSYQDMDNHDKGPRVNNGARSLILVTSGLVGLGGGLLLSYEFSGPNNNVTSNMFVGGALGLGGGIMVAALIMPHDYEVDQRTQSEFLLRHQAWLQDPVNLQVRQA